MNSTSQSSQGLGQFRTEEGASTPIQSPSTPPSPPPMPTLLAQQALSTVRQLPAQPTSVHSVTRGATGNQQAATTSAVGLKTFSQFPPIKNEIVDENWDDSTQPSASQKPPKATSQSNPPLMPGFEPANVAQQPQAAVLQQPVGAAGAAQQPQPQQLPPAGATVQQPPPAAAAQVALGPNIPNPNTITDDEIQQLNGELEAAAKGPDSSQAILAKYVAAGYLIESELEADTNGAYKAEAFTLPSEPDRICYRIKSMYVLKKRDGTEIKDASGNPLKFERTISTGASNPEMAVICAKKYMATIVGLANDESSMGNDFKTNAKSQRVFHVDFEYNAKGRATGVKGVRCYTAGGKSTVSYTPSAVSKSQQASGAPSSVKPKSAQPDFIEEEMGSNSIAIAVTDDIEKDFIRDDSVVRQQMKKQLEDSLKRLEEARKWFVVESRFGSTITPTSRLLQAIETDKLLRRTPGAVEDNCSHNGKELSKSRKKLISKEADLKSLQTELDNLPSPAQPAAGQTRQSDPVRDQLVQKIATLNQEIDQTANEIVDLEKRIGKELSEVIDQKKNMEYLVRDLRRQEAFFDDFKSGIVGTSSDEKAAQKELESWSKQCHTAIEAYEKANNTVMKSHFAGFVGEKSQVSPVNVTVTDRP